MPSRSHCSARRVASWPTRSRHRSPKFSAIRQTALHHARIHTALIWQQMRSEFGPGHPATPAPGPWTPKNALLESGRLARLEAPRKVRCSVQRNREEEPVGESFFSPGKMSCPGDHRRVARGQLSCICLLRCPGSSAFVLAFPRYHLQEQNCGIFQKFGTWPSVNPRSGRRALARASPRFWPHVRPLLTARP